MKWPEIDTVCVRWNLVKFTRQTSIRIPQNRAYRENSLNLATFRQQEDSIKTLSAKLMSDNIYIYVIGLLKEVVEWTKLLLISNITKYQTLPMLCCFHAKNYVTSCRKNKQYNELFLLGLYRRLTGWKLIEPPKLGYKRFFFFLH